MAEVLMNRPPAITWHRLRANGTVVELPGAAPLGTPDARGWLAANTTARRQVELVPGKEAEVQVDLDAVAGEVAVHAVDVVAPAGARGRVTIHVDGEGAEDAQASTLGAAIRVKAEAGAKVELELLQTLGTGFTYVENVDLELAEGARITLSQTELGASRTFAGVAAELAGDAADAEFDLRYLGRGDAQLDFNYALRQTGRDTHVNLVANGILADEARKTLRDTIDLVHGCSGSVGAETETVLLLGERTSNISLPVILCDEDDVQGTHGATIGHVNADQLDYLASRGLDEAEIEALFFGAVYDLAASRAHTEKARAAIERLRGALAEGEE
ncbi:MAG: SufD family Fe-S cluster assembly protein [Eggerthellaceae bacterium]|nr:SufD family Fe-S cluster assembly protein [Eggerthellaceae bacterium]